MKGDHPPLGVVAFLHGIPTLCQWKQTQEGRHNVVPCTIRWRVRGHFEGIIRAEHAEQSLHITLRAFRFMANRAHRMLGDGQIIYTSALRVSARG